MKNLAIDIETYSCTDLSKSGVYRYIEDSEFQILLFAYAFDNGAVRCIDLTKEKLPKKIIQSLTDSSIIKTAFNANFEIQCIQKELGLELDVSQWRCTMVQVGQLGFPMNLKGAAQALNLDTKKGSKGNMLIKYFSVPCKPTKINGGRPRNLPEHEREKWEMFKAYCVQDVEVERAIRNKLCEFPICKSEQEPWELDNKINSYGVLVDEDLLTQAIKLNEVNIELSISRMRNMTNLENPKSITQLKEWLEIKLGYNLNDLTKDTIKELINSVEDLKITEVLKLKLEISKTSNTKYTSIKACVCKDNRIRGLLQFYGANRTGRWAGRLVQIQNLPQSNIEDLDTAREVVRIGDYQLTKALFGGVSNLLSSLIRTVFIPEKGSRFVVADFSAIEARVIAWLAGEDWRLEVFKSHGKIYEASASQMFNIPIDKVDKKLRQKAKIAELALGYGGSVGALKSMGALDKGLTEDELPTLVGSWRASNLNIVKLWKRVENACFEALEGNKVKLNHGLEFKCSNNILFITLPSRRKLAYINPTIVENRFGRPSLRYKGMNQVTRKWEFIDTFGGKLVENVIQAIARDCLAYALLNVDKAGYKINFHVHDEIICEVPNNFGCVKDLENIMSKSPKWAEELPLRADGFECGYYTKG